MNWHKHVIRYPLRTEQKLFHEWSLSGNSREFNDDNGNENVIKQKV